MTLSPVHEWGHSWIIVAYLLWWANTASSVLCCIGIPYVLIEYEPPGLDAFTRATRLPLVGALTSAAEGDVICRYGALIDRLQTPVIIVSYVFVGVALPPILGFDTVFLTRLFQKSSPSQMNTYQEMILCGPEAKSALHCRRLAQ